MTTTIRMSVMIWWNNLPVWYVKLLCEKYKILLVTGRQIEQVYLEENN